MNCTCPNHNQKDAEQLIREGTARLCEILQIEQQETCKETLKMIYDRVLADGSYSANAATMALQLLTDAEHYGV